MPRCMILHILRERERERERERGGGGGAGGQHGPPVCSVTLLALRTGAALFV